MTRQFDIIEEIQLPCSKILVRFGSRSHNVQRIMDSLLLKFQPETNIKIISNKTGRFQTGFIYDYAFVMLIGLSILLTYLILK